jgi:hypothetical protein
MRAETTVDSAVVGTAVAAARRRRYHYEADVADGQPRDYRLVSFAAASSYAGRPAEQPRQPRVPDSVTVLSVELS